MNEAQRQSALQAMGIQSYFPRFIVPGAAPSAPCEASPEMFGLVAAAEASTGTRTSDLAEQLLSASGKQVKPDRPETAVLLNKQSSRTREPEATPKAIPKTVAPAPESTPFPGNQSGSTSTQQDVVHFKLAFILLSSGMALVNQLPTAGNGQMPASQQQLLGQIGKALGLRTEGRLFDAIHLFQWPMIDLPGMDNSLPAARSALLAFMEEHAQKKEISALIIMGRQLGELMAADKNKEVNSSAQNYKTITTYSLDQVMKMPSLKPELWHALLPLRSRA